MHGPTPPPRLAPPGAAFLVIAAAAAALLAPAGISAQGLTARLAGEASAMRWKEKVGLDDATFLGGGVSLGFGRYVTLRGSYRTAGTLGTAFAASEYRPFDSSLRENRVRASLWSSGVLFRLGAGRVVPVLGAGGGVLNLEPEGRDRIRQIQVGFGGGLDLRLTPWLDGQILVENVRLRLDRSLLAPADALPAQDPEGGVTRSAYGLSASFGLRASGGTQSARADEVDQGLGRLLSGDADGLMLPLEAHAGVLRFDDAMGLDDQPVVGVRSGLDLGPYFGVRGHIFRGVTDGFDDSRGMWGWSGELQFNVGKVTGASPYLLMGAGQTRFDDEYRAETGFTLENQNELILGAGVGIPVDDRTRVTVALRDRISTSDGVDQASSTSDLRHSFALTGGISVLLFGRREGRPEPRAGRAEAADSADYRSGRLLAIPVPKEGEVYVRYGPGGRTLPVGAGVDSAAVGAAVEEELIRMVGGGEAALSDSARAVLQARVLERLRALTAPPVSDTGAAAGGAPPAAPGVPAGAQAPGAPAAQPAAEPTVEELRRQVAELTRLVRESMMLQGAATLLGGGGTTVNVVSGASGAAAGEAASEPFLRALDARLGRSAMGDGGGGVALHLDAHVGRLRGDDNLIPFASLELARQGIRTDVSGRPAEGGASTLGLGFGVTAVLPRLGPVWPTASVLVAAARVGTSADRPTDENLMEDRFGGLSLGPGIELGAAYRPDPADRVFLTAALRKLWAGSTSRWSAQVGMRLVFPPRSGSPLGPFSMPRAQAGAGGPGTADTLRGTPTAAPVDTAGVPGPTIHPPPEEPTVAGLAARVEALEARLRQEAEARARAEAEARWERLRADSLAQAVRQPGAAVPARPAALLEALRARVAAGSAVTSVEDADGALRIVLGGTLFPVGATDAAAAQAGEVRGLGALLAAHPGAAVAVEGHTDDTGSEDANLTISRMRAEAVRRLLVEGGVPGDAVTARGLGESAPVADNGTREGRARNRRVEITLRPSPPGS